MKLTAGSSSIVVILFAPLLLAFGPAACQSKEPTSWKSYTYKKLDLSRAPSEVRLPKELMEKVTEMGDAPAGGGEGKGEGGEKKAAEKPAEKPAAEGAKELAKEGGGEPKKEMKEEGPAKPPQPTVFSPLKVYLIEKNPGILQNGNTQIDFGPGGGEIDFRDFVDPHNGSFYFVADFMPDLEDAVRNVYYLSRAEKRKIGKDTFGAGCESYFNVTTAFTKALKGTGFLVNTTAGRHISALAGSYFFTAAAKGKLYLASLTIRDSADHKFQCPPPAPESEEKKIEDQKED